MHMPHLTTNPHTANNILYRICRSLQLSDIKNGYAAKSSFTFGTGLYMQSYHALSVNPNTPALPGLYCLTDILDDALNCKLLTDTEYDYLIAYSESDKFNHGLRINQPL